MITKRSFIALISATAIFTHFSVLAAKNDYPNRPITLVVGFGAGGPTDIVARILAQDLSKKLGQTVIVDNKPGANGKIALNNVKNAAADGYTLIFASSGSLAIEPAYRKTITYDVFKDFVALSPAARYPYVMAVSASSDIKSIDDLIKKAKASQTSAKPLAYGSAGVGADNHLAIEWFSKEIGIPLLHVPFSQGEAASIHDMLSGGTEMSLLSLSGALPQVRSGKLRAIGITSDQRLDFFPDVPTVSESIGKKDFIVGPWNGVLAPKGIDSSIALKLSSNLNEIIQSDDFRKKLKDIGQYPFTERAGSFSDYIKEQQNHWSKVINDSKLEKLD